MVGIVKRENQVAGIGALASDSPDLFYSLLTLELVLDSDHLFHASHLPCLASTLGITFMSRQ